MSKVVSICTAVVTLAALSNKNQGALSLSAYRCEDLLHAIQTAIYACQTPPVIVDFWLLFAPCRHLQDGIAFMCVVHRPSHVFPPGDCSRAPFFSLTGALSHAVDPCMHISSVVRPSVLRRPLSTSDAFRRVFGEEKQWWRLFTSIFPLASVWELMLTLHLFRAFRVLER